MRLSSKEIMDMVSPVWFNAEKVKQSIETYLAIADKAQEINANGNGKFFKYVQDVALDTITVTMCKIYDDTNKRYKKHTIPELCKYMTDNLCDAKIRNPILLKSIGIEKLDEIPGKLPNKESNDCLKSLFIWRDKVVAHQEDVSSNEKIKEELKNFPTFDEIEIINKLSLNFYEIFVDIFTDDMALVFDSGRMKMATLNVIKEVLYNDPKKPILESYDKIKEFYYKEFRE